MKNAMVWFPVVAAVVIGLGLGSVLASEGEAARHDVLYSCACGPSCTCKTVSVEPGTCSCGTELVGGHVVKVEGTDALVCQCGADCTCKADAENPGKCSCGKELKRVSLKGTGIYFCNCGGSCTCNHLSAEPGTCGCGMKLKKADA